MDKRLKEISSQLSEYYLGRFNKKMKISTRLDEVDAITSGINMLGEELKAITISRNYFNNTLLIQYYYTFTLFLFFLEGTNSLKIYFHFFSQISNKMTAVASSIVLFGDSLTQVPKTSVISRLFC